MDARNRAIAVDRRSRPAPSFGPLIGPDPFVLCGYGQSNAEGARAYPALTQSPANFTLGGSVHYKTSCPEFEPFGSGLRRLTPSQATWQALTLTDGTCVECDTLLTGEQARRVPSNAGVKGETPAVAAAEVLHRLTGATFVVGCCAVKGRSIRQLQKGGRYYRRYPSFLSQVGRPVAAIDLIIGETDYSIGDSVKFQRSLMRMFTDMRADAESYGRIPAFMMAVPGLGSTRDRDQDGRPDLHIASAIAEFARRTPGAYAYAPVYGYGENDGKHLKIRGMQRLGVKLGEALHHVLVRQQAWEPMSALEIHTSGVQTEVHLLTPEPPAKVAACGGQILTTWGFRAIDDSGEVEIAAIEQSAETVITITWTRPPGPGVLYYAGQAGYRGQSHGGRGNICDSARIEEIGSLGPDAADLADNPNWLLPFCLPLNWLHPDLDETGSQGRNSKSMAVLEPSLSTLR